MFEKRLGHCPKCKALCDLNQEHDCELAKRFFEAMTQVAVPARERDPVESRKDRRARERVERKRNKENSNG